MVSRGFAAWVDFQEIMEIGFRSLKAPAASGRGFGRAGAEARIIFGGVFGTTEVMP